MLGSNKAGHKFADTHSEYLDLQKSIFFLKSCVDFQHFCCNLNLHSVNARLVFVGFLPNESLKFSWMANSNENSVEFFFSFA